MAKTVDDNSLFTRLTLGVVKSLEKRQGVCDVKLEEKQPVEKHVLTSWEQKYSCLMPDDVKDFYLTSNGFRMRWNAKMNETGNPSSMLILRRRWISPICEIAARVLFSSWYSCVLTRECLKCNRKEYAHTLTETRIPVGRMEINTIDHLVRIGGVSGGTGPDKKLPSLSDINCENETGTDGKDVCRPRFDHKSRIFELDPCDGYGKVCLVYNNTKPDEVQCNDGDDFGFDDGIPAQKADIWFLDRSLQWHHLAEDFQSYFRLMLMHLGLPFWQFAFTDIGLPPQAKQWFNMYAPIRMDMHAKASFSDTSNDSTDIVPQSLDVAKVFKGKSDKKKQQPQLNQVKKRPGAPSARTQTFMGRTTLGQAAKGQK